MSEDSVMARPNAAAEIKNHYFSIGRIYFLPAQIHQPRCMGICRCPQRRKWGTVAAATEYFMHSERCIHQQEPRTSDRQSEGMDGRRWVAAFICRLDGRLNWLTGDKRRVEPTLSYTVRHVVDAGSLGFDGFKRLFLVDRSSWKYVDILIRGRFVNWYQRLGFNPHARGQKTIFLLRAN